MTWFRLSIVSPREQVDNFSEFILESGAISLDIEDYNHCLLYTSDAADD